MDEPKETMMDEPRKETLVLPKGGVLFSFNTDKVGEVMRIGCREDGTLVVTIKGNLYDAAQTFWDILKEIAKPGHEVEIER